MTRYKTLEGKDAVTKFIDDYGIHVIGITQNEDSFTIFYN